MYDVAIIGTGVAGISAALTLQSRDKSILLIGKKDLSKKIGIAEQIRNYPGLGIVSGAQMAENFLNHLREMNIGITDKHVTEVGVAGDHFNILCGMEELQAYSVILAMGVANAKVYPGEEKLLGKGVSYCATCDGFLYKNKPIAVVCMSKEFESEIDYLAQTASEVFLLALYKEPKKFGENVHLISGKDLIISGEDKVKGITLDGTEYTVDACFIMRESIAPGSLLKGLEIEDNHIHVDRACRTNIPGCFAAGDCTGRPYQYVKAGGEGNVAAHSALEYLAAKGFKGNSKTRPYKQSPLSFRDAIDVTDTSGISTEADIDRLVQFNLTHGEVELIEKDTVERGDVVTFSARGGEGRYAKDGLRLTAGTNLYNADVENALIGKKCGDSVTVLVNGWDVTVTVRSVAKAVALEATDDMVKALELPGIENLADYRAKTKKETHSNEIGLISYYVFSELYAEAKQEEPSEEIIQRLGDLELDYFDVMFKKEKGKGIYEMTPEELLPTLGVKTPEEFREQRHDWYKIKYNQVLLYSMAMDIELMGKYDYMNTYEALMNLQMEGMRRISLELLGEEAV
ncbi:MAG: FAD-dependent oxidoreductase [Lachnospiraceae bacterium]|nr:FAD-dependent oxidoreductase [Lachnospiraceae bacterium]